MPGYTDAELLEMVAQAAQPVNPRLVIALRVAREVLDELETTDLHAEDRDPYAVWEWHGRLRESLRSLLDALSERP